MTAAVDPDEVCLGCRYFVRHTRFDAAVHAEVNMKTGDCRRMSPRVRLDRNGAAMSGVWPAVQTLDFCGEWKAAA